MSVATSEGVRPVLSGIAAHNMDIVAKTTTIVALGASPRLESVTARRLREFICCIRDILTFVVKQRLPIHILLETLFRRR